MHVKSTSLLSQVSNKQVIEIVPRMSSKYGLFLLVVLLRVTKVSKELGINLELKPLHRSYALHGTSTLTQRLLDTILMVLDTLITGGMMLLLHHSRKR